MTFVEGYRYAKRSLASAVRARLPDSIKKFAGSTIHNLRELDCVDRILGVLRKVLLV